MNRQVVFEWVKERYGTEPDYPWNDCCAVLRHKGSKKWYCVMPRIGRDKIGLAGNALVDILNVKCDTFIIGSLRKKEGYHPAYHMNKDKWITIRLDGSVPDDEIKNMIELSYELTLDKKSRRL